MLIETLHHDAKAARVARDTNKASLLTTLYSEAYSLGKNQGNRLPDDVETLSVIKKFHKNLKDTLAHLTPNTLHYTKTVEEISIVEQYMPRQIGEQEIVETLKYLRTAHNPLKMADVMNYFRQRYPEQYDGRQVAKLAQPYVVSNI